MVHDSPAQADTALIIDLSNLAYRAHYANSSLATKDGTPSGHIYGSMNMLQALLRDLGTSISPIFCMDGSGAKEERQKILPEYKTNREKRDFDPLPGVKELCQYLPGLHIEQEGREGDDAIAYACKLCPNKNVIIHSGDRDLQALITFMKLITC
jgi:DNA polymerase-1